MRSASQRVQEATDVGLHGPVRELELAELAVEGATEVLATVVLLDVLLTTFAEIEARRLEDLDLDHLRVPAGDAHVHPPLGAAALDLEAVDGTARHAQVADHDAGGVEAADEGPLDHPRRRMSVAARGDAGALLEHRAVSHGHVQRQLGGDVDVDEADDAVLAEQLGAAARLPDDAGVDLGAGFDRLERVDLDVGGDVRLLADDALIADGHTLAERGSRLDVAVLAEDRPQHLGRGADVGVGADHAVARLGVVLDDHVVAEHGVLADAGRVGDLGVVADVGRPADVLDGVEVDALADENAMLQLDAGDARRDLAIQEVAVGREVLGQAADVLPVALGDEAVERRAHLEELGKQVLAEVVLLVGRDVIEDLRLEHVDAGVDGVAEHLAPGGLLEEAFDAALLVDHHDAELERVLDALEGDGDHGAALLVKGEDLTEVEVGEGVATDDDEGVVAEMVLSQLDAAGGARRRLLDGVLHVHAEEGAVAEVVADDLGQEHEGDDRLVEAVLREELDDVLHAGLAAQGHHRLGLVARERPQAGAFAAGHDDCTHVPHLRFRPSDGGVDRAAIVPERAERAERGAGLRRLRRARGRGAGLRRLRRRFPRLPQPVDRLVAVQQAAGHVQRRAHGEEAPADDAQIDDEPLDGADEDEIAGLPQRLICGPSRAKWSDGMIRARMMPSRINSGTTAHHGSVPKYQSMATSVKKKSRSTVGSTQRPNSLCTLYLRAMRPSATSLSAAKRTIQAVVQAAPGAYRA